VGFYRRLLRVCAPWFADEYGAAMEETFARRLADARRAGRWRVVWLWQREVIGLVMLGFKKAGRMDVIQQELRYAARRLWRTPAFTVAAALTLALAIGANAAIFTVVHRVVLNPLPYPEAERLIQIDHGSYRLNAPEGIGLTPGLYFHYAARAQTLESIAVYRTQDLTLTGNGAPERIRVARVAASLARVLGVAPHQGRWFTEDEGRPGAARVVVLSDLLWRRRFGGDPRVLGALTTLGGEAATIIGVMPSSFRFPEPQVELWAVEQLTPAAGFGLWTFNGVARLHHGRTLDAARAELTGLLADVGAAYPNDPFAAGNAMAKMFFAGETLKDAALGNIERGLWILLASVGLVLLVACANVANLFLVRSDARQRDVAVRRALGADAGRIARYFFTESVLLAVIGGAVGLAIAWIAVRLVIGFAPPNLPRLHEIRIDLVVVGFTAIVSLVAAAVFGIIPLTRTGNVVLALHESGRSHTVGVRRHRARHLLMGAQVAVALMLLVAAGLMVRSFQRLRAVDPGFNPESTLTFGIGLPERRYRTREEAVAAHVAILQRVSTLPGVIRTSASTCLPLQAACFGNTLRVEGRTYEGTVPPIGFFRAVAADYFGATGMRLIRGRGLSHDDIERAAPSVVINEALANRFFPGQNPIGQRIASNRAPVSIGQPPQLTWLEIVGIVSDTPSSRVLPAGPAAPQIFMPMSIAGGPGMPVNSLIGPDVSVMSYVVRTSTPPLDLVADVRRAVAAVDSDLAIAQVTTLQTTLDRASSRMAFTMALLAIAAAVALALGLIGIYGVMSYVVSQRTGEIGLRVALGAEPRTVAADIVRQGAVVASVGIVIGATAALATGTLLESLLFGVSPRDPAVVLLTAVSVFVASLLACWLPARRAARLSPLEALRTD
jgi:predicted permease